MTAEDITEQAITAAVERHGPGLIALAALLGLPLPTPSDY